jgi:hypothetical protein
MSVMGRERIDNLTEAKHLLRHEHREQDVAYVVPEITGVSGGRHRVDAVGMDGIQADFAALRDAERRLAELHDDLAGHLTEAEELTGPLSDGTSPVTGPMRAAFHSRADNEGGVQAALLQYMNELMAVRNGISETVSTYEDAETHAVSELGNPRTQGEGMA